MRFFSFVFCCFFLCATSQAQKENLSPTAWLFRGQYSIQKAEYAKALFAFQQAYKELSHWGIVQLELAKALHFTGKKASLVEKHLQLALQKLKNNPRVYDFAGTFYEGMTQDKQAFDMYLKALQLGSVEENSYFRAAFLAILLQKTSLVLPFLLKRVHYSKQTQIHYEWIAKCYQKQKQAKLAADYWQRTLRMQPNALFLWKEGFQFFQTYLPTLPNKEKKVWKPFFSALQKKQIQLKKRKKRKTRKNLRPLLPSKR